MKVKTMTKENEYRIYKEVKINRLVHQEKGIYIDTILRENILDISETDLVETNLTARRFYTAFCVADDLTLFEEELKNDKVDFQYSVLVGNGNSIPYSKLTFTELVDFYEAQSFLEDEDKILPHLFARGYGRLDWYLVRILTKEEYQLLNSVENIERNW